jgi:hypothetical protein
VVTGSGQELGLEVKGRVRATCIVGLRLVFGWGLRLG